MEFIDPSDEDEVQMKSEEDQIVLIMVSQPESSGGTGNDQLETKKDSPLKTLEEKTETVKASSQVEPEKLKTEA